MKWRFLRYYKSSNCASSRFYLFKYTTDRLQSERQKMGTKNVIKETTGTILKERMTHVRKKKLSFVVYLFVWLLTFRTVVTHCPSLWLFAFGSVPWQNSRSWRRNILFLFFELSSCRYIANKCAYSPCFPSVWWEQTAVIICRADNEKIKKNTAVEDSYIYM